MERNHSELTGKKKKVVVYKWKAGRYNQIIFEQDLEVEQCAS